METLVFQTNHYAWVPRATFMPLLTGGKKPVFADDWTTLQPSPTRISNRTRRFICRRK